MTDVRVDTAAIDALFAPFASANQPGLVVGVALHGEPVYRKGFGVASVEIPAPLTPGTRMRIGSVSKHFSALALLVLIEEKLAALDEPIRAYAPALPHHADAITLRHLLQHTGGLRCGLDILMSMAGIGMPMPASTVIDILAKQEASQFAPGTGWSYNNSGYALIGSVIEQLTHRPLSEVLRERLFLPLDMTHTMLRPIDTDLLPNSATLHVPAAGGTWTRGIFGPPLGAEGGIVATLDDMLRWLAHMRRPTLGSADTWGAMRRSAVLENGHETGYGMGLVLSQWRGHSLVHHAGGVIGGSAQMMALPELGLDVMLIANRAAIDVPQLAKDVLAACVANADPVIAIDVPTPANGIFRSPSSGMVIELGTLDGRQTLSLMGAAAPVRFRSDGTIALEVDLGVAIRVPTGETEPSSIDYLGLGGRETLERIVPPSRIDRSLLGNYVSREAEAEARVIEAGELLRLETRSRYGAMTYRVQPIGPGLWSAAPAGAPVPFGAIIERDAEGFRFSTRRARRVRFERRD